MVDEAGFAVDWPASANFAPIDVAKALVAQTYPQHRDFATKVSYYVIRDACFQGGARSWRDDNMTRGQLFDLSQGYLVIAMDYWFPAQFPQVLGEVVNKGIVVVYYQYHFSGLSPG